MEEGVVADAGVTVRGITGSCIFLIRSRSLVLAVEPRGVVAVAVVAAATGRADDFGGSKSMRGGVILPDRSLTTPC